MTPHPRPTPCSCDSPGAAPRRRTIAPADPWQAAIAAFTHRREPMHGWPTERRRAIRLDDDEPHEEEMEARIVRLMASLPRELPDADRRILEALARHGATSLRKLARQLEMDRAYLSRRLRKLTDARQVRRGDDAWQLHRPDTGA